MYLENVHDLCAVISNLNGRTLFARVTVLFIEKHEDVRYYDVTVSQFVCKYASILLFRLVFLFAQGIGCDYSFFEVDDGFEEVFIGGFRVKLALYGDVTLLKRNGFLVLGSDRHIVDVVEHIGVFLLHRFQDLDLEHFEGLRVQCLGVLHVKVDERRFVSLCRIIAIFKTIL